MKNLLLFVAVGGIFYLIWRDMGKFQSRNVGEAIDVLGTEMKTYIGGVENK